MLEFGNPAFRFGPRKGVPIPAIGQGGVVYEAEAVALFARMTVQPDATRKGLINTLILALKAGGSWAKRDAIYVMAAHDAQASRRNWIADQYNLTAVSGPVFTADRGYAGDGSGAYLDTTLNPATAVSSKLTQNSASVAVWNRSARAANATVQLGAQNSATSVIYIQTRFNGDLFTGFLNNTTPGDTVANTVSNGFYAVNRSTSTALQLYKNNASVLAATKASVAPPSATITLLASNRQGSTPTAFSADQLAFSAIGGHLTAAELLAEYSAVQSYLQTVGAA